MRSVIDGKVVMRRMTIPLHDLKDYIITHRLFAIFEVLAAVLLRIQFFIDVTLCGCRRFEVSYEKLATTHPKTPPYISEEANP